jgi:RNA polymerase sigma-70 factor (ECF subfamily)
LSDIDPDLLRRCREGDQAAWRDLVSEHGRKVFNLAYRFVGRVDEAEDVTQEIFVKVYRSLDRFQPSYGSFPAWLMTVARHHAIDRYRRRRDERHRVADDPAALAAVPAQDEGPLKILEREERKRLVHRGLRSLPLTLREPLILCDLEGLSHEDAAASLEIPVGTVKSRLNRGRLELAKRLLAATSRSAPGA